MMMPTRIDVYCLTRLLRDGSRRCRHGASCGPYRSLSAGKLTDRIRARLLPTPCFPRHKEHLASFTYPSRQILQLRSPFSETKCGVSRGRYVLAMSWMMRMYEANIVVGFDILGGGMGNRRLHVEY